MSKAVTVIEGRGLFIGDRMICNGIPEIVQAYYRPGNSTPSNLLVRIRIGSFKVLIHDRPLGEKARESKKFPVRVTKNLLTCFSALCIISIVSSDTPKSGGPYQ